MPESRDSGCGLESTPTYCVTLCKLLPLSEPHSPGEKGDTLKNMESTEQEGIPWDPGKGQRNPGDIPGDCDPLSRALW